MDLDTLLQRIESAEDLFVELGVPFDIRVIAVHRMRILRRFGRALAQLASAKEQWTEAEKRARYAASLGEIHEQCARGMREPEPVFHGFDQQLVQLRRKGTT